MIDNFDETQKPQTGDYEDKYKKNDLGGFCVLQPDSIEQKEISILIQMHFKLQRFFCSGQDTKAD